MEYFFHISIQCPHCCPHAQSNSLPIKASVVCSLLSVLGCLIEKWVSRQKSAVSYRLYKCVLIAFAMHNYFANFYESVWHFAQSFEHSDSARRKRDFFKDFAITIQSNYLNKRLRKRKVNHMYLFHSCNYKLTIEL